LNSAPSHGILVLNLNGSFTYTPTPGYSGADSFTYHANDGQADSNVATVSITVTTANTAPLAVDDTYNTLEDTPLVVPVPGVLLNDSDVDNDPLTAVLNSVPSHGTLDLNLNGSLTYTPAAGFSGVDAFTYHANDGLANSNLATVSITVTLVNTAPLAVDDAYNTLEDTPLVVTAPGLLLNDTDMDNDSLTAVLNSAPSNGTLLLSTDGSLTYTPAAGFSGLDTFTYHANDGLADSNLATVSITVTLVNTAPLAVDDAYNTLADTPLILPTPGVLLNDTDGDNDPLTTVLDSAPSMVP
jgi:VCBS repeat-containing protein